MSNTLLDVPANTPPHLIHRSQRWRDRRASFLLPDSVIDPSEYAVDVISKSDAASFVADHHYLRTCPPGVMAVGLFRNSKPSSRLVGVTLFSNPMNAAAIPLHTGLPATAGVELGRLVLLDEVATNGESFLLSRAFKLLRRSRPQLEAITAYSDPTPRFAPDGTLTHKGHVGHCYTALMGPRCYRGQRPKRRVLITPDGQVFPDRTLSKIRNSERGSAYATDALLRLGAPRPTSADLRAWVADLISAGFLAQRWAAGVHAYSFPLTRAARRAAAHLPSPPPPTRAPLGPRGDVTALPLFGR
ncbi:MAG: hypothetical protein Q8R98_26015 [Rubrivivax sp.]|nr:hypothetical protein [Rubrivivax sp.]MDZ4053052.1 hypothetical protein [Phenylobacterium sp.]